MSRRARKGQKSRMRIAVALLAALAGIGIVLLALHVKDPSEGVFPVTIENGLARPVDVRLCSADSCASKGDIHRIASGESFWENLGQTYPNAYLVTTTAGLRVGCLHLPARAHPAAYTVRITRQRMIASGSCPS